MSSTKPRPKSPLDGPMIQLLWAPLASALVLASTDWIASFGSMVITGAYLVVATYVIFAPALYFVFWRNPADLRRDTSARADATEITIADVKAMALALTDGLIADFAASTEDDEDQDQGYHTGKLSGIMAMSKALQEFLMATNQHGASTTPTSQERT